MRSAGFGGGGGPEAAGSHNRLDMFTEMRTAALLAKAAGADARAVSAAEALEMATLEGARALGLEAEIGSIAPGKAADPAAGEPSPLATLPCLAPVPHLVLPPREAHLPP